jgi:hypothetical protein
LILAAGLTCAVAAALAIGPRFVYVQDSSIQNAALDSADWVDDLDLHAQMPNVHAVMGGYAWGISADTSDIGVLAWDGKAMRQGGKTKDSCTTLWTDGTRMYAGRLAADLITVTYSGKVGTFTQGEAVSQETSGATGWFVRDDGTKLYIQDEFGSAAWAAHATNETITGGDSGATAEAPTVATDTDAAFLQVSTDGFSDFKVVQDFQDTFYPRSFIDCGTINGSQLLLCIGTRDANGNITSIYWNRPDTNDDWTLLGSSIANSFRHVHGGVVIRGVNGTSTNRLVLFTGDTDIHVSIVICDNLADGADGLLDDFATWKTRWGWDQVGGTAKTAFLTTGAGAAYSYGAGSQLYRTVDIVADADKAFGYYIPDTTTTTLLKLTKVNLSTGTITQPGTTTTTNEGSIGRLLSNESVVISTFGGTGVVGTDYLELYAVTETGNDMKRLWAKPLVATGTQWFYGVEEFPTGDTSVKETNPIWLTTIGDGSALEGGSVVGRIFRRGEGPQRALLNSGTSPVRQPIINLLENGRFRRGWDGTAYSKSIRWMTQAVTATKETTTVDSVGGNDVVVKLVPTGSGASYIEYTPLPEALDAMRGNWVTLKVRALWPTATTDTQDIRVDFLRGGYTTLTTAPSAESDDWQTVEMRTFIPSDVTSASVRFRARVTGSDTDDIFFSDASLVVGAYLGQLPGNSLSFDDRKAHMHVGTSGPAQPLYNGLLWLDTDNGANGSLFIYANGDWREVGDISP